MNRVRMILVEAEGEDISVIQAAVKELLAQSAMPIELPETEEEPEPDPPYDINSQR